MAMRESPGINVRCKKKTWTVMRRFANYICNLVESTVSVDVERPIRRRRGLQNNFINEFQTKIPADVTVLNKSKMVAIYIIMIEPCVF